MTLGIYEYELNVIETIRMFEVAFGIIYLCFYLVQFKSVSKKGLT